MVSYTLFSFLIRLWWKIQNLMNTWCLLRIMHTNVKELRALNVEPIWMHALLRCFL